MNICQFISVQVLHKRIRGGGRVKVAAYMLTRGVGGQNFGKSAYIIIERSLTGYLYTEQTPQNPFMLSPHCSLDHAYRRTIQPVQDHGYYHIGKAS